jgi:hypothetical protein
LLGGLPLLFIVINLTSYIIWAICIYFLASDFLRSRALCSVRYGCSQCYGLASEYVRDCVYCTVL